MDWDNLRKKMRSTVDTAMDQSGARALWERPDVQRAVSAAADVSGEIVREVQGAGRAVAAMIDRRPAEDDLKQLKERLQRMRPPEE